MAKILEKPIRHRFTIDGTITGIGTHIFADGVEVHGVRSIDYHLGASEISTITMEIIPERCNLTELSDLELTVDIDSLHTAIKCIQFEMKLNKDFRDAMIASVASALTEHDASKESAVEIAEAVVERIFFGEDE